MKKLAHIFSLGLILTSCELMVEVDVPSTPPKLVVNSIFSSDSTWQVNISTTHHILSGQPQILQYEPVPHLVDENGVTIPLVRDDTNPWGGPSNVSGWDYRGNTKPIPGMTYRLQVSAYTYNNTEAVANCPITTSIISAKLDSANMSIESNGQAIIPLEVTFQDPTGKGDYYFSQMFLTQEYWYLNHTTGDTTWDQFESLVYMQENKPSADFLDFNEEADIIDDNNFDGEIYTLKRYITVYMNSFGGRGRNLSMRFTLSHSKEEYYKYFRSVRLQSNASGNPFAQPVQVYSNVDGGLGIFAGYTVSSWEFIE
jgi:hypothetical protein